MNALKRARAKSRLTLAELAEKSGVDQATISMAENGRRRPYPATLAKLADALGVDFSEFEDLAFQPEDDKKPGNRGGKRPGAGRKPKTANKPGEAVAAPVAA